VNQKKINTSLTLGNKISLSTSKPIVIAKHHGIHWLKIIPSYTANEKLEIQLKNL
jgi:hypothetical protein